MKSQVIRILALATVLIMIVSMGFVMPASAEHNWAEEILDSGDSIGYYPVIDMDNSNNPVIAYGSPFGVNYTFKSGSSWVYEHVNDDQVQGIDMVMDNSGNPHIAYVYGSYFKDGIKYSTKTGGSWTTTTVLNSTRTFEFISIDLDASGNPYILGVVTDSGLNSITLTLFYQASGVWQQESVTTDSGYEGYDMAISSSRIHVVYNEYSKSTLGHASRTLAGGNWQYRTIDDVSFSEKAVAIDLDSTGLPQVMLGGLYYRFDGTLWNDESISHTHSGNLEWVGLHIDAQDNIYSAIFLDYNLVYVENTGSGWEVETVRDMNDGWYCSVTADSSGQPHIAYYAPNWYNLTYLEGSPAAINPDTDADGLPDNWETTHFGNLDQDGTDDPDGDGHDNEDEQTNGTDPNDPDDPYVDPADIDGDGLPDSWEQENFGNLDQDADDDPDNDLFDNEDEYDAGSDPNDASSTPLDIGLSILGSVIMWIVVGVILIIVVIIALLLLLVKAADDEVSTEPQPQPIYEYPPPPPPAVEAAPSRFCPFCGHSLLEKDAKGGKCPKCGAGV